MTVKNQKLLLITVALLATIKFIVLPFFEWQNETKQSAQTSLERLNKMEGALASQEELKEKLAEAEKALAQLETQFPMITNVDAFRLEQQQRINEIADKHDVDVSLVSWDDSIPEANDGLMIQPLKLELSGATKKLALVHTELLQVFSNAKQKNAELTLRGSLLKSLYGNLRLSMDFYHRAEEVAL